MGQIDYARVGELHIAYQVVGDGPVDIVFLPAWFSHLEAIWQSRRFAAFLERLASFSRLILFDQRGTGLSDPVSIDELPTLEERADDIIAVMDAAGSRQAAVVGAALGGALGLYFAASHPDRVTSLVLFNATARRTEDLDYPGLAPELVEFVATSMQPQWGRDAENEDEDGAFLRYLQRMSLAPGAASELYRMNAEMDVRDVLPAVRVPTLIINREDEGGHLQLHAEGTRIPIEQGRYIAQHIEGATYLEVAGQGSVFLIEDDPEVLDQVQEFLTGIRPPPLVDRVLSTVLFTDLVSSTETASDLGDRPWRDVLEAHAASVTSQVDFFQGNLIKMTGDGMLATFDGPTRAVKCAVAVRDAIGHIGMRVRSGLHTGEVELLANDVGGIAVHIGARVSALAEPGEILASSTVVDLVTGSGLEFEDRGEHELKGIDRPWRIYSLTRPRRRVGDQVRGPMRAPSFLGPPS